MRSWLAPYQFRPGESGNPNGRPKGRSVTSILRELLDATSLGGEEIPGGRTAADALAEAMLIHAIKGNPVYMREVLARTEGKVPEKVELIGDPPKPRIVPGRRKGKPRPNDASRSADGGGDRNGHVPE